MALQSFKTLTLSTFPPSHSQLARFGPLPAKK